MEEPINKETHKEYELGYILRAEEDRSQVVKLLENHKAQITEDGHVRRVALQYPIEKVTNAFFGFFRFRMEPGLAKDLEGDLRAEKSVLRSLIIVLSKEALAAASGRKPYAKSAEKAPVEVATGPLSNEALQEKIEEILA